MVLTSNLVVSFWVSTSDPTVTATWHRVFILNNAVKKSWERRCFSKRLPIPTRSVWRRKLRVRSMAWAPQIRRWPKNHARPVEATWGTFLLAVSNDDGEIILLLISSPYTANSTSWDANIVKLLCFDGDEYLPQDPIQNDTLELLSRASNPKDRSSVPAKHKLLGRNADNANHRPSLFRSAIRSKPFIHNIAWSPWTYSPDAESLLSFTRGGAVFHCVFHVSFIFPTSTYFSYVPRFSLKWQFRCKENSFNLTDNLIAWHGSVSIFLVKIESSGYNRLSPIANQWRVLLYHKPERPNRCVKLGHRQIKVSSIQQKSTRYSTGYRSMEWKRG